jgi:DNA-binding response OmpR family regulator
MAKKKKKAKKRSEQKSKIMVVEDDLTLLETLEYNLVSEGYEVITAGDGLTALEIAREEEPDLILLDLMLPRLDGFEVCRILRRETSVPILMLTARADEVDRVVGLEVGADDYLTKPFSMRELLARVKALLRRVRLTREEMAMEQGVSGTEQMAFDDLVIDLDRREVLVRDESLRLAPMPVAEVVSPPVDRLRPQAERAGLELTVLLPPGLPPVLADADQARLVLLRTTDLEFTNARRKSVTCARAELTAAAGA